MRGIKIDCKTGKISIVEDKDIKININELALIEDEIRIQQKIREISLRELEKERTTNER